MVSSWAVLCSYIGETSFCFGQPPKLPRFLFESPVLLSRLELWMVSPDIPTYEFLYHNVYIYILYNIYYIYISHKYICITYIYIFMYHTYIYIYHIYIYIYIYIVYNLYIDISHGIYIYIYHIYIYIIYI